MHDHHDHDHSHQHDHDNHYSDMQARVKALETLLTEKGLIDPAAIDAIVETYETKVGPSNGAHVVAKAWSDADFADWLRRDATAAIASLGYTGRQGEHMRAVFNTAETHNLVVCTLCSCYPWSVLGLPPVWYKAPAYRSRAVIDPRGVLAEFGADAAGGQEDPRLGFDGGTALPRHSRTARRDRRNGRAVARRPRQPRCDDRHGGRPQAGERRMNGPHDLGGQMGFGPVAPEKNEPYFHAEWEKRALGITLSCGAFGAWTIDESRHARENIPPADYLAASYYEIWIRGIDKLLERHGFATRAELLSGHAQQPGAVPKRVLKADMVPGVLAKGGPCDRPVETAPLFAVGETVRTKNFNPVTHTRLPRYARAKTGVVEAVQGSFVFPDDNAHGKGENPQWLYTVVFDGAEIWGEDADPDADRVDRCLGELS